MSSSILFSRHTHSLIFRNRSYSHKIKARLQIGQTAHGSVSPSQPSLHPCKSLRLRCIIPLGKNRHINHIFSIAILPQIAVFAFTPRVRLLYEDIIR